jgi:hypothetical protein
MRLRRVRFTVRRMMVAVGILAVLAGVLKRAHDPVETFHSRTGLGGRGTTRVIATRYDVTFHGEPEFAVVFDTDPEVVARWASGRPPGGWRGWYTGRVPHWITAMCPVARQAFSDIPIGRPESPAVRFLFRGSPVHDHRGDLIVVDLPIGRVWFLSWGY